MSVEARLTPLNPRYPLLDVELRPEDRRHFGDDVRQRRRLAHRIEQPGFQALQARHVGKDLQRLLAAEPSIAAEHQQLRDALLLRVRECAATAVQLTQKRRCESQAADEPVERVANLVACHREEVLLQLLLLLLGLGQLLRCEAQPSLLAVWT